MNQLLFDEREAYGRLKISRSTLRRLRAAGRLKPVYVGRAVRYTETELARFVESLTAEQHAAV